MWRFFSSSSFLHFYDNAHHLGDVRSVSRNSTFMFAYKIHGIVFADFYLFFFFFACSNFTFVAYIDIFLKTYTFSTYSVSFVRSVKQKETRINRISCAFFFSLPLSLFSCIFAFERVQSGSFTSIFIRLHVSRPLFLFAFGRKQSCNA